MERTRKGLVDSILKRKLLSDSDKKEKVLNALFDENLLKRSIIKR